MKKTTIASALISVSLALGTAAAYAQAVSSSNPNAAGDVKSMPKAPASAKDTSMEGGSGNAIISPNAAGDVKSKPKAPATAKDTSMSGYTGNGAPANPGAADDVTGKPTENGKTASSRMSKNSKTAKNKLPPCTSTTASGTDCTQQ